MANFNKNYSHCTKVVVQTNLPKVGMKITPQFGFLKFYVMGPTGINLYDIANVKVDIIARQKIYIIPTLGRFVCKTTFIQCALLNKVDIVLRRIYIFNVGLLLKTF